MDITQRLSWILLLPIVIGCGGPEQPTSGDQPAAEATSPNVEKGGEGSSPSAADVDPAVPGKDATETEGPKSPPLDEGQMTPPKTSDGAVDPETVAPGPTIAQWEAWAEALSGNDAGARQTAAEDLEKLAADGTVVFVDALQDESPDVRRCAAFYLIDRFDPSDAAMAQAFTAALSDSDGPVRRMALSVAKRFPKDALAVAATQLATTLENQGETAANRAAVARLIATLEVDARPVLPKLLSSMQDDPDKSVRSASLMAVSRVAEPADAVAAFRKTLANDEDASVRGLAAVRLGRLGSAAEAATADLANAMEDGDDNVARKAADALIAIGAASVPSVTEKLNSTNAGVRRLAVFVLGKLGPSASPALGELRKRLQDEDQEVRQLTELAIQRIEGGE